MELPKETEMRISAKYIYPETRFPRKNTITPDGSVAGEVVGGGRNSNARGVGRKMPRGPNREYHHLAAKNVDWANRMVGESLYRRKLEILRYRGNDSNGGLGARSALVDGWKSNAKSR